MIDKYLSSKWDVDDDGSLHKTMLRPDSAPSRDRRKRKAEGRNDGNMTFKRRRGRLPPSSTEPSRDTFWSQGTHSESHSHARSGSPLGSSSPSATHVSTRSQSLRSYSRSKKATSLRRRKLWMYFIFRFAHHVLDIEIVVISLHRIVTFRRTVLYNFIDLISCRTNYLITDCVSKVIKLRYNIRP